MREAPQIWKPKDSSDVANGYGKVSEGTSVPPTMRAVIPREPMLNRARVAARAQMAAPTSTCRHHPREEQVSCARFRLVVVRETAYRVGVVSLETFASHLEW